MLVLNRRPGEAILLEGGVRIVVLKTSRRGARIGIDAPKDLAIRREELLEGQVDEERRDALPSPAADDGGS